MSPFKKSKRPKTAKRVTGWRAIVKRLAMIALILMVLPIPFILLFAMVQPPITSVMLQRVVARTANGERPIWPAHTTVSRRELSPYLRRAVLASEDDRFYLHFGIDTVEINNALERRRRGGKLRGASTLTQQVAKNLFLWNGRSFVRKGIEAYIALLLELILSKERILDLYLNLAEWGPNAFGAEAAAQLHFRKSAADLTREEAARLAAILPAPRRWSPKGSIATRRAATILMRMQYAAPKTEPPAPSRKARKA
ncbi:monofunctional biosynthetic peptidoglycan transglycosylase [Gemmatimonas groenlandica]|uniref:Biosynthetic peptidoglycan transglycosylase n=1 Tax=Gemmatimonas groenlandica TaxID=2732249 RepID=A0A6M4IIT8_9BACT|nr:monofunctional biosynthetic peptidoglycan transglycosylase [Gemmatimonas groenlandica]QJR34693.1 monofunctional biosynthetic peptidoglycan transglycosylase [Gemmatimonas groenlandica]